MTNEEQLEQERLEQQREDELTNGIIAERSKQERLKATLERLKIEKEQLSSELFDREQEASPYWARMEAQKGRTEDWFRSARAAIGRTNNSVVRLQNELTDMQEKFRINKKMSAASKKIVKCTEEYVQQYESVQTLRRSILGYMTGLDTIFYDQERLRELMESDGYLPNTDVWIAYAAMAMMYWVEDHREAAERAMKAALRMQRQKTSLFFLLMNLRFDRREAAEEWLVYYLEGENTDDLSEEWLYLIQACLSESFAGALNLREKILQRMRELAERESPNSDASGGEALERAYCFADTFPHRSREQFDELRYCCAPEVYEEMMNALSCAEKYDCLRAWIAALKEQERQKPRDVQLRIDDVLYDLVSSPEAREVELLREMRRNRYILEAYGDEKTANSRIEEEKRAAGRKKGLKDLLLDWAFAPKDSKIPVSVQRFAVSLLKNQIMAGFRQYAEKCQASVHEEYIFEVDGCKLSCAVDALDGEAEKKLGYEQKLCRYYQTHLHRMMMREQYFWKSLLVTLMGAGVLGIALFQLVQEKPSVPAFIVGALLVLIGCIRFRHQANEVRKLLIAQQEAAIRQLEAGLQDLQRWRRCVQSANDGFERLWAELEQFS